MSRITEAEVADAVESILRQRIDGQALIADLIEEIPSVVNLSPEDLTPSPTRPGEAIWEQQVRNITSHKGSPGNAIFEGRLVSIPGGLQLASIRSAA